MKQGLRIFHLGLGLLLVAAALNQSQAQRNDPDLLEPLEEFESPSLPAVAPQPADLPPPPSAATMESEGAPIIEAPSFDEPAEMPVETVQQEMPAPVKAPPAPKPTAKRRGSGRASTKNLRPSPPNENKEKHFHDIFQKFYKNGTDQGAWDSAIAARSSQYNVQQGDTLWALSQTLFGDPNYWPKIWAVNSESIFNPHEISPAMQIQFVPGTSHGAPQIAMNSGSPIQEQPGSLSALPSQTEPPSALPWDSKGRPVLMQLPASLPAYKVFEEEKAAQVDFQVPPPPKPMSERFISYYVDVLSEDAVGEVVETEPGFMTAFTGQPVIVRLPPGQSSGRLMVVSNEGEIDSLGLDLPNDLSLIQVQGEIEIGELVNAEENFYRAKVMKALFPVRVGAKLVTGRIEKTSLLRFGSAGNTPGVVIGGEYFNGRRALGLGSLIFLFSPEQATFEKNQILDVYPNLEKRKGRTGVKTNALPIAKIRIVRPQGNVATGIVVQSDQEIEVMDSLSSYRSPD